MSKVAIMEHQWVLIQFVPVVVMPDSQGRPMVFEDPMAEVEDSDKQYGCAVCCEPLETAYGKLCNGETP